MSVLFQPISLHGGLTLRNRIVIAPMTTWSSHDDGMIADDELAYLERRAKGGFGAIVTAACYVHPSGHAFDGQWGCEHDGRHQSLRAAVEAIHKGNCAAILQIHHGGRQCPSRLLGHPAWSASAIPAERPNAETPDAMTEDQIEEIIAAFASAAYRAKQAGFDGVEIHGANTYLVQQFVSPHSNRREDKWAEPLLFPTELTEAVLAAVGPNYPVGYRFSPEEIETPGIRWPLTETLVDRLAGYPLAYLHTSLRHYAMGSLVGDFEDSVLTRIVKVVAGRMPVVGVGKIKTEADALATLALGADIVALGQVAISEPEWPNVILAGGEPRVRIPAADAGSLLDIPREFTRRIYENKGWFDVESAEPVS